MTDYPATDAHESATLAADLVLFDDQDNVLLARRANNPCFGEWALPGGRVDAGERFYAAAVREAMEETGLDLADVRLIELGVFDDPDRDPRGRVVSIAYTARVTGTARAGSDAAELRWVNPDEALKQGLAFDHAAILYRALDRLYDGALD